MSINPISLTILYQGKTIIVDDVSKLIQSRWREAVELQNAAKEIGSNLKHDLCRRVDLIQNTLIKHLPEAKKQGKNILIASLKTAFLSSLIAGAIFSGLFVGLGTSIVLGIAASAVSIMFYAMTATRKSRWENVLAKQNEQLANIIPSFCEFYKQHGETLIEKLKEKIQAPQNPWSLNRKEDWEQTLECVDAQVAFLKNFDPTVPDLNMNVEHKPMPQI